MKNKNLFIQNKYFLAYLKYARHCCRHVETEVNKTDKNPAFMKEEKIVSSYLLTSKLELVIPTILKAPSTWKAGLLQTQTVKPQVHPLIMHRVQIHFILYQLSLTFHLLNWMVACGHNTKWNFVVYHYLEQLLWRGLTMKYQVTICSQEMHSF